MTKFKLTMAALAITIASCGEPAKGPEYPDLNESFTVEFKDTSPTFPPEGGKIILELESYVTKPHGNGRAPKEEKLPVIPDGVSARMDGGSFSIIAVRNGNNSTCIDLEAGLNTTGQVKRDVVVIEVAYGPEIVVKKVDIIQLKGDVTVKRAIQCSTAGPVEIPAEGGTFMIPFRSVTEIFIDGELKETAPSDLKGLHFEWVEVNSAAVHRAGFSKTGTEPGDYLITYTAEGPYNLDHLWTGGREYYVETKSYVRIFQTGDTEDLLEIEFIHPQTPGEEYYYGRSSFYHRTPLDE